MNLVKCDLGHYYDGDKYTACPHCAKAQGGDPGTETKPLEGKGGTMKMCPNGHYYDTSRYSSCPSCNHQTGGDDTTVPLKPAKEQKEVPDEDLGDATIMLDALKNGTNPVVGWLVCVAGIDKEVGKSFELHADKNFIGRSPASSVCLSDTSISRERHAVIIYEPHEKIFFAQPGESSKLYYINGKVVLGNVELKAFDALELGKTKLIFVPFCGEKFSWDGLTEKEDEK